ncbi:pyrimidine nucleoside phosphorylase [Gordonia hirsuta DSM 44140 = NBRC 16056]|uniref:Pyrimidine nucleoside phosphorylase n=1 Tax=Gordonia hirsuta DSM 44140 = NBRC 16056 TaxID=1121927 RepID=L7L6A6_9ACTN|nr:thymidine phosphorylase [Gordonia hirsuta]GAC56685.1 pyrimidine nucleoside phosphorylase [Gordonia hirsuta DSM 44140 = NBRC 16056]
MTAALDPVSIIGVKRDGGQLTTAQIRAVVDGFTSGQVAPEQMSALAMAICWRGMVRREIADWTAAMIDSGVRLDLTELRRHGRSLPTVDKHSTGGVGDKVTLPLTPLIASYGVAVPQLSGRGLGHTGGTLDKLDAVPGFSAQLSPERMRSQLAQVGAVIAAASDELAPADRKLYALRDVTGTVASIPLIAASIMSKKIAEGTGALVLDVKVGSGAFMREYDDAAELAATMVELGSDAGVVTSALLTDMSSPLGRSAGNALEVAEALEVLAGGGPDDVVEVTLALAREMLAAVGLDGVDPAAHLSGGQAMDTWRAMIAAQGGDPAAALPVAAHREVITAADSGWLTELDALSVGLAAWELGAGRAVPGAAVSAGAGVQWHAAIGDRIVAGQPLFTLHADQPQRFDAAGAHLAGAVRIAPQRPPEAAGRILGAIGAAT